MREGSTSFGACEVLEPVVQQKKHVTLFSVSEQLLDARSLLWNFIQWLQLSQLRAHLATFGTPDRVAWGTTHKSVKVVGIISQNVFIE